MITQNFTPEQFTSYAFAQVRKAAEEDENVAQIRMLALSRSIDIAKSSFEQTASASIPVIEAAVQTEQTMSHQEALGSERGGAISNPEDLGKDLTSAPNPGKDSLNKSLDEALAGLSTALGVGDPPPAKKAETVVKGMGDPNKAFEDLDDMRWPEDMSTGKVDTEWGDD